MIGAVDAVHPASIRYLLSLWNMDGGFGDRRGLSSRPESTYLALDSLCTLDALDALDDVPKKRRALQVAKPLPANLKPFTIQIEAHGEGSPTEAVELAKALRIHLWGAKNSTPRWIKRARTIADRERVPVRFFVSNEEYGTFVGLPGLGAYSHTSDIIVPADSDFGASMAGKTSPPAWTTFRDRRVVQLESANGRLVWQVVDNEDYERILLDDSVLRQGYAAISSFHFETDFVSNQPFVMRYRHHLPFVALQDAHGPEAWWWTDRLVAFRTIFLATEPTWEAWLHAMKQQWVVSVRHDEITGFRTQMLGGAPKVQEFIRERVQEWKWWGNGPEEVLRPLVSIVAVKPKDTFEEGRPEDGVVVRVRCRWRGHTRPAKQVTELVNLYVDEKSIEPRLIEKKDEKGMLGDHYYLYRLPTSIAGVHTATATVRMMESKLESKRTIKFTAY